ncbi:hypothetical protein C1645_878136 [Glomus cerebriforme]|uniref:FAD-binding PCMH-type domain-containing protein n=1 Tax=Glomus cerebriforme TaxID=658196 RepID=A0A397SM77_9GLOM|nr:hypothetical protein C1645_878136 [Glomus cerebriforme]
MPQRIAAVISNKDNNDNNNNNNNKNSKNEGEQGYDEAIIRWSSYAIKKAGMVVQREVNQETHKYGLACVSACIDNVDVGGYMLEKYGLSINNLVAATIVLADGSVKQLSATSNPDLFWAIRGCGFNFGVIYEFLGDLLLISGKNFALSTLQFDFRSNEGIEMKKLCLSVRWLDDKYDKEAFKWLKPNERNVFGGYDKRLCNAC